MPSSTLGAAHRVVLHGLAELLHWFLVRQKRAHAYEAALAARHPAFDAPRMNKPSSNDALLKLLLRLIGWVELCAIPFLLFPFAWMNEVHDRALGLGPLPSAPIVDYMARSLSAMYAVHGAVVFRVSFDVERFRPLIVFLGWLHVTLGAVILATDLAAGLPWWWVGGEGPGIAGGGFLVLLLARNAPHAPNTPTAAG